MSQASQSISVTRLKNGVSYSSLIVAAKGDLYQEYNQQRVVPDFSVASNQPEASLICAPTGATDAIPPSIEIYWDETRVEFDSLVTGSINKASAGLAAGTLQISQQGDAASGLNWKIRFLKNIATPSATPLASHVLKIVGIFPAGKTAAQKSFDLSVLSESGLRVHIEAGGDDAVPFVVNQNIANSKCTLVAQVYSGGTPISNPAGCTYKWHRKEASESTGWKLIAGQTQRTMVVTANDIDAYAEYKVTVTQAGSEVSDTQSVMDVGDPYYVAISVKDQNNATADPAMNGDVSAAESRIFTASLASRSGGTPPTPKQTNWIITTVDGVIQNNFAGNTNSQGVASRTYNTATLTLPAAWMDSLNGGAGVQMLEVTTQITY